MILNLDRSVWKRVRFGDVIQNVSDRVDDPSTAGVDRYVGLEHLDPGSMTVNRWGSPTDVEATKLRFQPGDVIFGRRRAYQKKVARADFEGICSAHAMVLRAKPGHVDADFLPVFLSSDVFLDRAVQISVGSLSPTVNWKTLAVQEFDLPPLDEQKRMADLLWATERTSRAYAQCADVGARVVAGQVDRLIDDASWPERKLGDLLSVCQYGSSTRAGAAGKYPMLRMTNLRDGRVMADDLTYADLSDREYGMYRLNPGDVLFNRTNSYELVGRSALFDLDGDYVFASYLVRLRTTPQLLPDYLNLFINSSLGQSRVRVHVSRGVSQANVSASKLQKVSLRVPPLDTQQTVIRKCTSLAESVQLARRAEQATRELAHQLRVALLEGSRT